MKSNKKKTAKKTTEAKDSKVYGNTFTSSNAVVSQQPIIVSTPNVSREKMDAITTLSQTVLELSRALNSVNTNVTVSHCTLTGNGSSPLISIKQD